LITHFDEVAISSGVAGNSQGKGDGFQHGSIGDLDGDGFLDIMIVDLEYGSLYRSLGNGLFEDITEKSGLAGVLAGKGSWGAALLTMTMTVISTFSLPMARQRN